MEIDRYVLDKIEADAQALIRRTLGKEKLVTLSPAPPKIDADYGINLSAVALEAGMNPTQLASLLGTKIFEHKPAWLETTTSLDSFLNFTLEMGSVGPQVINQVLALGEKYGHDNVGHGETIVDDTSSPNVAKRMSVGHLRSTVIGAAIANLYEARGYKVLRDNHLGDWGNQFGEIFTAVNKWSDEETIKKSDDPVGTLQKLYEKYHEAVKQEKERLVADKLKQVKETGMAAVDGLEEAVEARIADIMKKKNIGREEVDENKVTADALAKIIDTPLERDSRGWFHKLEQGDPTARRLWEMAVNVSMPEFQTVYDALGVNFDLVLGESFYEDKMPAVIKEIKRKKIGYEKDGALVVDLKDEGLGEAVILRSDGSTLYMTRDLACAIYREDVLGAEAALYVVGEDQKDYFQQMFGVLRKMGRHIGKTSKHIYFGMIRLEEGRMSTRKGRTILLQDVINEGIKRAKNVFESRKGDFVNPDQIDSVVKKIAIGALKWSDLGKSPRRSFTFNWDEALNLEGYSAASVQYAGVRAKRILEKSGITSNQLAQNPLSETEGILGSQPERNLVKAVAAYPRALATAQVENNPSILASHVYDIAKNFNTFYNSTPVLNTESEDPNVKQARLGLVAAALQTLANGLDILEIELPEAM